MTARAAARTLLLLSATLLAGCAGEEAANGPCPPVVLLDAAKEMTVFREGPGRDLSDVEYWFEITDLSASCEYKEGLMAGVIDVAGSVSVAVEKGPAASAGPATYALFTSLTNRTRDVLRRDRFDGSITLAPGETRAIATRPFATSVALLPEETGFDYIIYLGFQLTPEQLLYRRQRDKD